MSFYLKHQEYLFDSAIESIEILEEWENEIENSHSVQLIDIAQALHSHYNKLISCVLNVHQYEENF